VATINRRSSRKSLALALAIVGVAGLSMASAAQLTVNSTDVVAGVDTVGACDADGVTVTYSPTYTVGTGYTVSSVTIGDLIDGSCEGMVFATATGAAGANLDSGSIAHPGVGVDTVVVPFSGPVSVALIEGIAVAIG